MSSDGVNPARGGGDDDGSVVTKLSPWSVADTVARLSAVIAARGMQVFTVIDQSGEAQAAGLELRDTKLVIDLDWPGASWRSAACARSRRLVPGLERRWEIPLPTGHKRTTGTLRFSPSSARWGRNGSHGGIYQR
jgi:hypothetical protein